MHANKIQCSTSHFMETFVNPTMKFLTMFKWKWLTEFIFWAVAAAI